MNLPVNIAVLSIIIGIQSLLMGGLLVVVSLWQSNRAARGLTLRGLAMLLQGVGYLLKAERGILPDSLTVYLSIALMMTGHGMTLCSLRMLLGLPAYVRQVSAVLASCWLSIVLIVQLGSEPRQTAFALMAEMYSIGYAIAVIWSLRRSLSQGRAIGERMLLATTVFMMATQVWLFVSHWTSSSSLMASTAIMMLTALMPTLTGVAFLLMYTRASQADLKALTQIDPLTGLANRRVISAYLESIRQRSSTKSRLYSVLMIDVDHFKSINDRYGHLVGDTVLVAVAKRLKASVPRGVMVGRFGGDEFIVIEADAEEAGTLRQAERLRAEIDGLNITFNADAIAVTVSIGIALHVPSECADEHVQLFAADKALLQAKREGRNRVAIGERTSMIASCTGSTEMHI